MKVIHSAWVQATSQLPIYHGEWSLSDLCPCVVLSYRSHVHGLWQELVNYELK